MRFTPISEAAAKTQASTFGLWQRGIYDFEVTEAKDRISASGNAMIELNVTVYNKEGHTRKVYDYLIDSEKTGYKVRHFASSVGLSKEYENGELDAEALIGKSGKLQLYIKKDKAGVYPDKNAVSDYVPVVPGAPLIASRAPEELDDEIPF